MAAAAALQTLPRQPLPRQSRGTVTRQVQAAPFTRPAALPAASRGAPLPGIGAPAAVPPPARSPAAVWGEGRWQPPPLLRNGGTTLPPWAGTATLKAPALDQSPACPRARLLFWRLSLAHRNDPSARFALQPPLSWRGDRSAGSRHASSQCVALLGLWPRVWTHTPPRVPFPTRAFRLPPRPRISAFRPPTCRRCHPPGPPSAATTMRA